MSSFEKTLDRMIEVAHELGQARHPSKARELLDARVIDSLIIANEEFHAAAAELASCLTEAVCRGTADIPLAYRAGMALKRYKSLTELAPKNEARGAVNGSYWIAQSDWRTITMEMPLDDDAYAKGYQDAIAAVTRRLNVPVSPAAQQQGQAVAVVVEDRVGVPIVWIDPPPSPRPPPGTKLYAPPMQQDGGEVVTQPTDENIEAFLSERMTPEGRIPMVKTIKEALTHFTCMDRAYNPGCCDIHAVAQKPAPPSAPVGVEAVRYDAGLLSDYGGGNVEWWQDYIRAELERAHDFYTEALTQQPAAVHEPCAAVAAIQFALTDPEGMTFLRLWNEGEFDTLRREWPDAPSEVYVGADPSVAQQPAAVAVDVETLPEFLDRIARELVERDTHRDTFAAGIASSLRGRALVLRAAQHQEPKS